MFSDFNTNDGLKASMLLMNGLVRDFTFSAKLKDRAKPLSTLFYLPPNPNVAYSAALMSKAEETFTTGKASYPVDWTLLTSASSRPDAIHLPRAKNYWRHHTLM